MPKPRGRYSKQTRRDIANEQRQLISRVGQGTVALVGLASSLASFTAFGVSWSTIGFVVLVVALLESLLLNVLFVVNSRQNESQPKRIAFLAPSSGGQPFYTAMLIGLVQSASLAIGQNYLIVPSLPTQSFESMSIWALFASLEDRQVDIDGIIFIPDDPDAHFDEIVGFHEERGDIPLVLADVFFDLDACDEHTRARLPSFVGGDERAGGRIAAEIIIDALESPPVAPVILVVNGGSASWEQQRTHAFRECVRQKWPAAQFIETPYFNYSRPAAFAHTLELLKAMATSTNEVELHAVFACNDDMAIGVRTAVARALREGYVFPFPPQIVGYDGISEIGEYIQADDVFIAGTVDVRLEDQARAAMLLMHKQLRSGQPRSDIELIAPRAIRRPRE